MGAEGGCLSGITAALLRRGGSAGRHGGYELAGRHEEEEEEGADEQYEAVLFEEENLGAEALETRGDRFMAMARRRSSGFSWWALAHSPTYIFVAEYFKEAALSCVLAKNWRKAAIAYGERAIQFLKGGSGSELDAAYALLCSSRCYRKMSCKDEEDAAAIKLALEKALELYVKPGRDTQVLAATCCRELAEAYEEKEEWRDAALYFEEAARYYGSTIRYNSRHCTDKATRMRRMEMHIQKPCSSF